MSVCSTCRHWHRSDGEYDPESWGRCEWVPDISGSGLSGSLRIEGEKPEHYGAVTRDYEGYASTLTTHESFGCNRHERS